jgi:hypothetical protein
MVLRLTLLTAWQSAAACSRYSTIIGTVRSGHMGYGLFRNVHLAAAAMFRRALLVITRDASAAHVHKPRPRANLIAPSRAGPMRACAISGPGCIPTPRAYPLSPLRAGPELSSIDSLGIVLVEQCLARPAELRPVRPQTALDRGVAPNRAKAKSHDIASA